MTTRQETINKGSLFFHFSNRVHAESARVRAQGL